VPVAIVVAVVIAEAAVALMWPRHGVIEPAPVRAASYFSGTDLERARDFRRPQVLLGLAAMAVELGLLALLVARPPRRLRGPFRRPILAAAVAGAALSVLVNAAPLPVHVVARQRAKDVGLVTQSWPGYGFDLIRSWAIGAVFAAVGAAIAVGLIRRMPRTWWIPGSVAVVAFGAITTYAGRQRDGYGKRYFQDYSWSWMQMMVRRRPGVSPSTATGVPVLRISSPIGPAS